MGFKGTIRASPVDELESDVGSSGVCIAEQLAWIEVTADQRDLWHRQAHLKQTADRFVSEIVKVQVGDPRDGQ